MSNPCSISDCQGSVVARGWCRTHYSRWYRHGDPLTVKRVVGTTLDRFWHYVQQQNDGHWMWTGPTATSGPLLYGVLCESETGKHVKAHRYSYELHVGVIPDDLEIDHLCRVTLCVAPNHLEAVTHRVNVLRGEASNAQAVRRDHCPRGHEYAILPGSGRRYCAACKSEQGKERRGGAAATRPRATHCGNGHEYTEENTRIPRGFPNRRECRACDRALSKARYVPRVPRSSVPAPPKPTSERKPRRLKTHCKRNHELSGPNLYVNPRTGGRACLTCKRAKSLEAYYRDRG